MASGTSTKDKIKRAALELFVAQGVDGTGMREIAKASGITEGAIYRHFKGKDELVWVLFSSSYAEYALKLDALQKAETLAADKIAAMVRGFCRFFDDDETLFRFLLIVQHNQLSKIADDDVTPVTVLIDVIQGGVDAGEISGVDAVEGAAWVLGIVLQSATFKTYDRLPGPLSARAEALVGACLGALGLTGAKA